MFRPKPCNNRPPVTAQRPVRPTHKPVFFQCAYATRNPHVASDKYSLTEDRKARLRRDGRSEKEIIVIEHSARAFGSMNDIDDGYGMRPLTVDEIHSLAEERSSRPAPVSSKMKK